MKLVEGLKLDIGYTLQDITNAVCDKINISEKDIRRLEIVKESLDARRKPNIYYNLNVAIDCSSKACKGLKDVVVSYDGINERVCKTNKSRPIIVGFGPAGMFMALKLAKSGLRPIVIEKGDTVDIRQQKIDKFWNTGKLDVYSNVHFGEGGAGTFSDGKLNSNISNNFCKLVTNELILHGAPKEIYYKSKPHIGTDNLRNIVKSIRQEIILLGGEIYFNTNLDDIEIINNSVKSITCHNFINNEKLKFNCDVLILAIGHSAKDVFCLLKDKNVKMEQKPFAMGVRIEQKQKDINMAQYGKVDNRLPSADYKLVEHLSNGRSVFTFCMCPGGQVVASSSEEKTIVTNGMSYFARDKENANSALLVNVDPSDFRSNDVLAGFDFQSKYEHLAFELGGGNYKAPVQSVGSFLKGNNCVHIAPTYLPGVTEASIEKCLPDFVTKAIKEALPKLEKKIKNFANDSNILTAIESKSSCPVRIIRGENCDTSVIGLYAIGEGAGYAGGIMSSAQDGLKVADYVIQFMTN